MMTREPSRSRSRSVEPVVLDRATVRSPVGDILVYGRGARVCGLVFHDRGERLDAYFQARFGRFETRAVRDPAGAVGAIEAYLRGQLDAIDAIDVDLGGTDFQASVWRALRDIPAGATRSYGELARVIGRPDAVRAVGAANGANPVSLIVPCHRVIASNGTLHGYGGGLERKKWLLLHERALLV